MTPAINLLRKAGIAHRVLSYPHEPGTALCLGQDYSLR